MSTAALTILSQFSSELGRSATIAALAAERLAFGCDFFQFVLLARRQHHVGAGAGQGLGRQRAEGARRAGDNGGLALDVEQRERVFQKGFGHSVLPVIFLVMARLVPAISLRRAQCLSKQGRRDRPGDDTVYFGGIATATTMVQTSLPRLMISRVSLGSMTQLSFAFSTVSLPSTMTVSSPRSTK